MKFPATVSAFEEAAGELRRTLDAHGLCARARYNVELVFDEIVSNIIRHGARDHPACAIEVSVDFHAAAVVMQFADNGRAFDPCNHPVRPLPESPDDAAIGGLGLLLVRNAAARIDYERTSQDLNRLTVTVATQA